MAAALAGVALVAALVYGQTADFGMTDTDDKVLLREDARFLAEGSFAETFSRPFFADQGRGEGYYRPLATQSLMFDHRRGEANPGTFHGTNIALHALATALALLLFLRLGLTLPASVVGALLFAVHPALVEVVAWIPGRTDGLLAVTGLGAMLLWLRYERTAGRVSLAGHGLLLFLALMSKEAAVVLPALAVVHATFVTRESRRLRRPEPWLLWAAALGSWALLRASSFDDSSAIAIGDRLATAVDHLPVLLTHLGKLVVPADLAVLAVVQDSALWPGLVSLLLVLAVGVTLRPEARPRYLFGVFWYLAFLLPTLPVSDYLILENRLYLPALGVIYLALVAAEDHLARRPSARRAALAIAAGLLIALTVMNRSYARAFEDQEAFTAAAVAGSPSCALAHLNRGIVHHRARRLPEAERHYRRALELRSTQQVVHNNLGVLLLARGELVEAEQMLRTELELNPSYAKAHYNLGLVLNQSGRPAEAEAAFRRTSELDPRSIDALGELMVMHARRGEHDEAAHLRERMEALGVEFFDPD